MYFDVIHYVDSIWNETTNLCSKGRNVIISHDETDWIAFHLWLLDVQVIKCNRPTSLATEKATLSCHSSFTNFLPVLSLCSASINGILF